MTDRTSKASARRARMLLTTNSVLGLALGSLIVAPASAQSDASDQADEGNDNVILVTAQKRSESVQDVPIAINAYTGEALTDRGIENTIDLQVIEPSLVYTTNAAFGQPYLRGVGSDLFTPGAESSIAVFVDDVYQSRTSSALQDFFDIERVDVVKGPQGVLFGRNAVGGAINVYSNKPTDEFEGFVSGTYGNYNKVRLEGALNVPIDNNGAAFRLSGLVSERDGYTDNVFTGGDVDGEGFLALRGQLAFDLGPDADVLLSASYSKEDSDRSLAARVDTSQGLAIADFFGAIRPDDPFEVALNEDSLIDIETFSASATLNWDFGGVSLKSITAYRETDLAIVLDLDASQLDFASNSPTQQSETFSQEIQLVSNGDGPFQWVLGGFYLSEEASQALNVELNFPAVTGAPSDFRDQPGGTVNTDSIGVFGNAKFEFSDQFAASVGLRYNYDQRDLDFLETISVASTGAIIAQIPLQLSDSYDAFTPRFVLEFTPTDDLLIYGSVSRGYKAGGFNTNVFQPAGFEPETLWAYELGAKSTFADGRGRLNAAAFYYDYSNLQLNTIPPGQPIGTFQIVINAAESTIKGFEADGAFDITDTVRLTGAFQILDAEFDDFVATNPNDPATGEINRAGTSLPRAPEFSANLGLEITIPIGSTDLLLRGDYRYESSQFLDIFADDAVQRDSNSVINARASIDINDQLNIAIWGRNLTGEDIVQSSLRVDGLFGTIQFFAPPRTYGATVRFDF